MNVRPRVGLGRGGDETGPTLFELVHGDPERIDEVDDVAIHDPLDQAAPPPNALVLGVGLHEAAQIARVLAELGRQGAAVLVVRSPVPTAPVVIAAAERTGVALVGLAPGASWVQAMVGLHWAPAGAATDAEIDAEIDRARRLHADLLNAVFGGDAAAATALRRLRLDGRPVAVCALALMPPADAAPTDAAPTGAAEARLIMQRQRLTARFATHLSAVHPRCAAGLLGDTAYGLVPIDRGGRRADRADRADRTDGEERVLRIAEEFLARGGEGVRAVIGVGPVAVGPAELAAARACADRVVRVLRALPGEESKAARLADVHGAALVHEMRERATGWGDRPTGPLARLLAYDERHDGHLVATLRAWLEAFGDVNAAAAAVYVHPSTFRYRLRRVVEIGGLDLADPEARFTAQLQLRVVDGLAHDAAAAGS